MGKYKKSMYVSHEFFKGATDAREYVKDLPRWGQPPERAAMFDKFGIVHSHRLAVEKRTEYEKGFFGYMEETFKENGWAVCEDWYKGLKPTGGLAVEPGGKMPTTAGGLKTTERVVASVANILKRPRVISSRRRRGDTSG